MKILLIVYLMICATVAFSSDVKVGTDVRAQIINVGSEFAEFTLTLPLDWRSVERGWRYVLRYVHHEPLAQFSFGLMLVRGESGEYVLALHQGDGISFEEFDQLTQSEKLVKAPYRKEVDSEIAQLLYDNWVNALFRARFGGAGRTATGMNLFYLSAYAFNTGYMCAEAPEYLPGSTTGRIASIGVLLKLFLEENDENKAGELMDRVRSLCLGNGKQDASSQ